MEIILFLVVGLIAGWLASNFVEGRGYGLIGDIVLGVIGASVGGFIFDLFGVSLFGFWGLLLVAVIGAVVFLFVVDLFTGTKMNSNKTK